jgi:ribose transport system permease protein
MSTTNESPIAVQPPAGNEPVEVPAKSREAGPLVRHLEAYALLGLLALAAIFFSFYSKTADTFPTAANLQTLIGSQAVVAVVALAALVPLVANEWDLSIGAVAGLAAIYAASLMADGTSLVLALGVALLVGVTIGLANALIVTRVRVNAVITTLGMSVIIAGIINQKTSGSAVTGAIPESLTDFGSGLWFGIPRTAFALAAIALIVYYVLEHTPAGRYLYALGSNPKGARLVGLRTRLLLGSTFVAAGMLSAAAGYLQVARAGGADPRVGETFTLPALAAAFLSAASIKPGRYNVGGTLVAIFFLATLNNGLNLAGAQPYVASYVNGAALIVGVGLAAYLGRKRTGHTD